MKGLKISIKISRSGNQNQMLKIKIILILSADYCFVMSQIQKKWDSKELNQYFFSVGLKYKFEKVAILCISNKFEPKIKKQ